MILSDISIRRPVLAAVASLIIIVFGIASLLKLPIRELPQVDSPVVSVTTTYTGASPQVVDTDITSIVEGAVAGISGVRTISSVSRRGRSRTQIEFDTGRNLDEAANDVRSAVGRVRGDLPDGVDEPSIVKNDADADPVMRLAIISDRMSPAEITDYAERFIIDRLATLDGVASVDIYGERRFAIRIWLDRRAMAARNLTVADVEAAIRRNNVERPAGDLTSIDRQFTVRLDTRLDTVDAFRNIVVDRVAGYPVRLDEIARIEQGAEDDQILVRSNGAEAVGLGVLRQSLANTIAISKAVRDQIEQIKPTLPPGMQIIVGSDDATFISTSIQEVLTALALSLVLVLLVMAAFLRSLRATIVPAVTIPVSLIGCFILINGFGYSINVLTLLALLLAIGLVVDDAIVVLENIQRRIDRGETPLVASMLGTRQVTFAVLATSVTLIAVFVPISFLEGAAGRLFVEFGMVMAIAVVISTFVALSLCPALAVRLLKGTSNASPAAASGEEVAGDGLLQRFYGGLLRRGLDAPLIVIAISLAVAGGSVWIYQKLPSELTPSEDRGIIFIPVTAPQGSTIGYTNAMAEQVEAFADPLVEAGDVDIVFSVTGSRGRPYLAFVVLRLAPWDAREHSHSDVIAGLAPKMAELVGARGFPIAPAGLGLRGSRTPLRVVIGGPDLETIKPWAERMAERAAENPGLRNVEIDYEESQPQLSLAIDRAKADDLGISIDTIGATLQTLLASREVTQYVDRGRTYPVIVQAMSGDRQTPADLENIFVRAGDGKTLVPLTALLTIREEAAAPELNRYDRLPSITVTASLVEGYDLGRAVTDMQELGRELLPPQIRMSFAGQSKEFLETSGGVAIVFGLAVLIVLLVLAAQFESFIHPFVIMFSVPLAFAGAVYALWLQGASINLYSQIGIVLLVGLMAKNGILIVEFANQLRDRGMEVRRAVYEASLVRLRPILMTAISTMLGAVPLVLAAGAGAESRIAIGTVIIGGLGLSTLLTLFLTPVLYNLLAGFSQPRSAVERRLAAELANTPAE
ncbi:MAG: efflux RND transporter permease subunit [Rhizobiaceae bacterium]